jgi:hypothetical protein
MEEEKETGRRRRRQGEEWKEKEAEKRRSIHGLDLRRNRRRMQATRRLGYCG